MVGQFGSHKLQQSRTWDLLQGQAAHLDHDSTKATSSFLPLHGGIWLWAVGETLLRSVLLHTHIHI